MATFVVQADAELQDRIAKAAANGHPGIALVEFQMQDSHVALVAA